MHNWKFYAPHSLSNFSALNSPTRIAWLCRARVFLDARSGLFLAAPRRTGKSTFLREDLLPVLKQQGWTTVYADLWTNKAADPAVLIANEVKNTLAKFAGAFPNTA